MSRADALFREGTTLLKEGSVADACARFAASKELAPAVGVTLYLADCLQRIGKTASAWTAFRDAEALARQRNDKRADLAHHRAEALSPSLNRITIEVAPSLAASAQISCDGKVVPREQWGTAVPVDPGSHVVMARAGQRSRVFEALVDANAPAATIRIDQLFGEKSEEPGPPAPATPTESEAIDSSASTPAESEASAASERDTRRLWISLGLAGVGVAGLGVGLGFGIAARSDRDQSNDGPCNAADQCNAKGLELRHDAIHEALVSTLAFGIGVAAVGASAVFAFVIPHGPKGNALTVTPAPLAGGAGAVLQTRF